MHLCGLHGKNKFLNFDVEINLFVLNHMTGYTVSEFVFVVFELPILNSPNIAMDKWRIL